MLLHIAATKHCPILMGAENAPVEETLCMGERCMGWTWDSPDKEFVRTAPGQKPDVFGVTLVQKKAEHWIWTIRVGNGERNGHCGMMARPIRIDPIPDAQATAWRGNIVTVDIGTQSAAERMLQNA